MDSELIHAFIEEAENYLPTIRGAILVCAADGKSRGELANAVRQTQILKGAALMVGLEEIGKTAAKLEKRLLEIFQTEAPLHDADARELLDRLAQIESLMMKARMGTEDFSLDFSEFVEASFENLQINLPAEAAAAAAADEAEESFESAWAEDFEIDEEMLEVFALEAEDLLKNINLNLAILKKQPANREALMEIRRNAHTFKGSAGIVGLQLPSQLAHRVEDLLDYLAENEIESDERIFQILMASTDCLSAMTGGENSEQLHGKLARIYADFDEIIASLNAGKSEAEKRKQAEKEISTAAAAAETTQFEIVSEQKPIQHPKSVVRVSLERLDDLVKIVSDLVVSRSVFEQRLGELDRQIEELQRSTRRLQRSTAKLETEFEADMLSADIKQKRNNFVFTPNGAPPLPGASAQFDSLEFDRYTEFHQTTRDLIETTNDTSAINSALDTLRGNLETLFTGQSRLIEEMQDKILRIRMVKFGALAARLQRTVRVTCEEEVKHADLVIEGESLEVDTQMLDFLVEPLLHLLRNAVAHGIEPPDTRRLLGKPEKGTINLRIANEGTHIALTVADDGRGISAAGLKEKAVESNFISRQAAAAMSDEEAFELIFLQGLTTAEKLSQTAGRGVGMNIVKTALERQQGTVTIVSNPQKGTAFTMRMPTALAVTRALLVRVNDQFFAFPLKLIKQITEISADALEKAKREKYLQLSNEKYTLSHLNELLGLHPLAFSGSETMSLLLLETAEKPCALLVDKIVRTEEIVVKPFGAPLQNMPEMLGAAILGDGSVVPVLDLIYLLKRKIKTPVIKKQAPENNPPPKFEKPPAALRIMIVDDSPSVRHLTSKVVKNAGFELLIAKDGLEALEILQTAKELPAVVLTDVEMPRMNGYELLASLKKQPNLQSIPVIMITSRTGEKHRQKAIELGVSEYLTKPFEDSVLIELISRLSG